MKKDAKYGLIISVLALFPAYAVFDYSPPPPDEEYVKSRVWEFSRTAGTVLAEETIFGVDGDLEAVAGYSNPNECKWMLNENKQLTLKKCNGEITTIFKEVSREYWLFGKYTLVGDTIGATDTHRLKELKRR